MTRRLDWTIQGATPQDGSSGLQKEGDAAASMTGSSADKGPKEKEERQEDTRMPHASNRTGRTGSEHPGAKRRRSRTKMHRDWINQRATPRTGSPGSENERDTATLRIGSSGDRGPEENEERHELGLQHRERGAREWNTPAPIEEGSSSAEEEGDATTPRIGSSRGRGPQETEERQEDAGMHQGEQGPRDWSISAPKEGGTASRCTWIRTSRKRHPGLDHPGRRKKETSPPSGLEHPEKGGQRRRRSGKKTPESNKEQGNEATRRQKKVEPQEEALGLDHLGRRTLAGRRWKEENCKAKTKDEEGG